MIGRAAGFETPDLEQLPRVVPFVHRVADVEPFVALKSNQLRAEHVREHFGDFGLADTGFALEKQRPAKLQRQEQRHGQVSVRDVSVPGEGVLERLDRLECDTPQLAVGPASRVHLGPRRRGGERALHVDRRHRAAVARPTRRCRRLHLPDPCRFHQRRRRWRRPTGVDPSTALRRPAAAARATRGRRWRPCTPCTYRWRPSRPPPRRPRRSATPGVRTWRRPMPGRASPPAPPRSPGFHRLRGWST